MQNWRTELNRLLVILALAGLAGALLGEVLLALLLALLAYCCVNIFQLRRLYQWLAQYSAGNRSEPPESFGLWGDIFDSIYRLQKQERKASEFLETIIDKAQESSAVLELAVVMIDKHNNLDWWNLAAEKLLGIKYPQDRKQPVTNLIRDPTFADYFSGENYDQPLQMHAPGDSKRMLEFQIALFGENERLMIVRDISQLQRLELMRTDFVGNVSHELGTPITVIKGYLEAILDNIDKLEEKWRKPMQQMHQQSLRMENIVKDLLILSELETKNLPLKQESIQLNSLLTGVCADAGQLYPDKHHEFSVDCPEQARLEGDRAELYSAFSNLVVNAAKYTPARGKIRVCARPGSDSFDVSVIDNGMGIDPQHVPRLTERFYRVDASRSSDSGGTGLGLAIVKHILLRHEADLDIRSEQGEGSRFTCRFPVYRSSDAAPRAASLQGKAIPQQPARAKLN